MIAETVVTFLATDNTLRTLLGATDTNNKYYPEIPQKQPTLPYVTFTWTAGAMVDEHVDEDRIQFIIHGSTAKNAMQIANRIKVLLDKKDGIQDNLHDSDSNYYIAYCKHSGADALYEPIRHEYQIILFFEVGYHSKTYIR